MASRAQSKVTTDHEEIRQWAEERGAEPACVRGTGGEGDIGMLRLEFPGAPGARDESLQPISWDDWFGKFDERGLALLFQEKTARGDSSNFNKIISRETAEAREEGDTKSSRRSGRRKSTGKRLAIAVAAGRLRSRSRRKSTKSASQKASPRTRAASTRKKTTKAASGTRSAAAKRRLAQPLPKRVRVLERLHPQNRPTTFDRYLAGEEAHVLTGPLQLAEELPGIPGVAPHDR